ncbi:MAG TPA: universal stress protein [Methylomirabilota bacterium]|jgi:nucleotide-binding universal stress UspA family protein
MTTTALPFRDVLFSTDFSEASRLAGRTAAELARHFGARLHVLHVVPPVTDPAPAPEALRAAAAELGTGLSVVTAMASGRAASQIVDYARRHAVDLIVMGTHGRTGVSRALLGSVAEAVVRRAGCRVLTVPASAASPAEAPVVDEVADTMSCAVCGGPSQDDLVCEACRARIRGEALERKRGEERAGRR